MNRKNHLSACVLLAALTLVFVLIGGCPNPTTPPSGDNVDVVKTGTPGATSLAATSDGSRIYIGYLTYSDGGALKYYDTVTETIETIVTGVDVGDFVLDETNNQIIGTSNSYSPTNWTYSIDLSGASYSASEIQDSGNNSFVGADVLLHNDTVYVLNSNIDWSFPFTADNTLYYFPADGFDPVTEVDLGTGVSYGFTRIGIYNNELYYTDTIGGEVYKSALDGTSLTQVTTAGDGSAGMIYFHNNQAFVADGYTPNQGVYTFNPASPPGSATQFGKSAAISAQFMAFVSATEAFVTNFNGGVYEFDPSTTSSSFTIVADTDLSYVDGVNGYGLQDIVAANGHLYVAVYADGSGAAPESELMIVDSY